MAQVDLPGEKNLYPDLPTGTVTNVTHPGKALTRRYQAPQSPGQMVESQQQSSHLASDVNFKPITTISYQDKNIHVRPINNTAQRHMSPLPINGSFKLPIRGERVFQVSADFQRQLQKRVGNIIDPYKDSPFPKQVPHVVTKVPKPPVPTDIAQPLNVQPLPFSIKPKPKPYVPLPQSIPTPQPPKEVTVRPVETVQVTLKPIEFQPSKTPKPAVVEEIKKEEIIPKAEVLPEEDKHKVEERSVEKREREEPKADTEMLETLNKLKEQLSLETLQKNVSQERIGELSNNYQSQVVKLIEENKKTINQIQELKNKLDQETKSRIAAENRISTATNPLITQINKLKIERDGLLGQVKEDENKLSAFKQRDQTLASSNVEITRLKAKIAQVENEKINVENKAIKYEGLINDLRGGRTDAPEIKKTIIPQFMGQKSKADVRIVEPAPAIGKMAPQLTTVPNVVSGIVKDSAGMLLTNVVIVVKDSTDNPVRALKSNKIGQFAISTPLPDGVYTMELEKEGSEFDVVQITLGGKVMPPIEIRGR